MEHIKGKINEVILLLEEGKISEHEAHIAIAEITTSIPEEDILSSFVNEFMETEIRTMDISEDDKRTLLNCLENEGHVED
ncbi:MAG: hypothetical protein CSB48_11525 [Proteobacteria bacterium]|nr:MAG: hypothetical protein CSB48_11525 [Pseudomonadota bacterium]PIE40104.1 MAG: hypothetical protein CSA51_02380 [Gammaproteobacteria bacterium]